MSESTFLRQALNGSVSLDDFSSYKLVKLNEREISNMPEKLLKQLKKENLYDNSYVGIVVLSGMEDFSVDVSSLPIYGVRKGYDTSFIKNSKEEAILVSLEKLKLN